MDTEEVTDLKLRLHFLIEDMDIPEMRRQLGPSDIRWLARNIGINNGHHPKLGEAKALIGKIERKHKW